MEKNREEVFHLTHDEEVLARSVPWWMLIPWLIGGVTGGDFFITNTFIVSQGGSLTVWGYFAATVFIVLMSLIYWELITMFPYTGGEYVYMSRSFGSFIGYMIFFLYAFNFVFWVPLNLSVIGAYIQYIFQTDISPIIFSIIFAVLIHWISYRGILFSTKIQVILSTAVIISQALILLYPLLTHPVEFLSLAATNLAPPEGYPTFPSKVATAMALSGLTITYMVGFEIVPLLSEEMVSSRKRMGYVQTMGSLGMGLLQILTALGMITLIPYEVWQSLSGGELSIPAAANRLHAELVPHWLVIVLLLGAILSGFATMITAITGFTRSLFAIARDHRLPGILASLHPRYKTPTAIILLSLAIGLFGSFQRWVVDYAFALVMATMFMYILIPIAHIILRYKEPHLERPVRTPGYPWINVIVTMWAAYMFWFQARTVPISVWYFMVVVVILGLIFYAGTYKSRREKLLAKGVQEHYGLKV